MKSIYSNLTTPQMNWLIAFILGLCTIWLMAIFNAILSVYRIGITIPIWIYIISIFLFANMIFFMELNMPNHSLALTIKLQANTRRH